MSLQLEPTPIAGLMRVARTGHADARGSFMRLFDRAESPLPAGRQIMQVNHSLTRGSGTVRGMHFQFPPHAETKVVTCLHGEVFDVAVDLRAGSRTFLQWYSIRLGGGSSDGLLIPAGMAHGFQVLTAEAQLLYLHDQPYHPASEGRVHPLDPRVAIAWPEQVQNLSARDETAPFLSAEFSGIQADP